MSSNIYLTQTQIHDLFQFCETKKTDIKTLEIPSFGDVNSSEPSPEFQQETYYFASSCRKEDNYTTNPTNNTNRHQDSILEIRDGTIRSMSIFTSVSKAEYENLKHQSQLYQQLVEKNNEMKAQKQLVGQIQSQKSQIYVLQECNKKLQKHIHDLLQSVQTLEQENQLFQEDLLQLRLQIQDQLKIIQQGKINIERLKITMIEKDESYIRLKDNYDKLNKDQEKQRPCKSVQRSTYSSHKGSSSILKTASRICYNNYCNSSLLIDGNKK